MYCLQCFSSERILVKHTSNCLTINGAQAINMSKQGENILRFNNFHKKGTKLQTKRRDGE